MELEGLSVVCAGLGCASEDANGRKNGYIKSENCLENLKDLQRFLRRDHPETRDVFKQLGKWNTMSQDLIPIIEHYRDEPDLIINTVKVIVFLTMPIDPSSDDIALQMEYLWNIKASFSRNDAIAVIISLLEEPLENLECGAITEDDWKVIQLVLTLFRNLLAIQDPSPQQMMGRSTSQFLFLRDAFLEHLFHENVMDLILALTQHVAGLHSFLKQDNLLLLEIYHYIFWGQRPELVASAQLMNSKKDSKSQCSSGILRSMMDEEEEQRRISHLKDLPRHSLFCGTFVRLAPDGSKRIVKRNPFITPAESILKTKQIKRGPVKRIACDTNIQVSSKESVLGLLKNFADQFLDTCYNVLMQSVREDIRKEHPAIQNSDIIVFFEVANFFTAYQRCCVTNSKGRSGNSKVNKYDEKGNDTLFRGLICGPIASTMNEAMFYMVISKWHDAFEALKETNDLKTLTTAGALVKEMIHMLDLVLKMSRSSLTETEQESRTARILLYKVFYDQTERGIARFLLTLIKAFDNHKQPRSHLADLVEITHIVLRLMETLKEADGTLRVLKKSRKGRKKEKMAGDQREQVAVQSGDFGVSPNPMKKACEKSCDTNEKVMDGVTNEKTMDEASEFNDEGLNSEKHIDDVEESNNIFKIKTNGKVDQSTDLDNNDECEEVECSENHVDGNMNPEDDDQGGNVEAEFDIAKFVSSFADNTVVRNYCWLLKYYKSNSAATNQYIIRMLQRICDDCMLAPMLYQLSLFAMFYEILSDQKTLHSEEYKNIVQFLTKFLRIFFKKLKDQPFLFVEILFWKTRRECNSISTDRMLSEMNKWKDNMDNAMKKGTADAFGDDEADAIKKWQNTGGIYKRNIADALGDDEADMPSQFDCHEKEGFTGEKRPSPKKRRSTVFNEEQESQIRELFEQYKGNRRCSLMIAEALDPDGKISAAQVSRKLKQLGLKVAASKRKSGDDNLLNGEDDGNADAEDNTPDNPSSAEAIRKTSRKRLILNSGEELDDESQQKNLLKASEKQKSPVKDKNKKFSKKRKIFVFSEEHEGLLKELYEQHKESTECSHLIAESLGLSVLHVNQKLKLLGLKVTSRKRKSRVECSSVGDYKAAARAFNDDDDVNQEPLTTKSLKAAEKQKSPTKDKNKRSSQKRKSYVFTEEQESLLKELFEQNKESKQCSHLLSEALGLPVAEINRKLKLLGFKVTSRKQKFEIMKRSEGIEGEDDSDHVPLITKLSKSQNIQQHKKKKTQAYNESVKKFGTVDHSSDKDNYKIISGVADEVDSDDEPLSAKLLRSPNMRLSKEKMAEARNRSLKKSRVTEHDIDKDVNSEHGEGLEDDSGDEVLVTSLSRSQNSRMQQRKAAVACNEPLKESGYSKHCMKKDDKLVPVVEDEDESDDEPILTKLFRSPNMRLPKKKMTPADNVLMKESRVAKCFSEKEEETAPTVAVEDDPENETLMVHMLKDKLPKNLNTESSKARGIKTADQPHVVLVGLEDLEVMKPGSTADIIAESASNTVNSGTLLSTEDEVQDMDILPQIQEPTQESQRAISAEPDAMSTINNNVEEDLMELEDNLEETSSKAEDNDSVVNEESATKLLKDPNLTGRSRRKLTMIIDDDED